jgi:hypothetical protein
VVCLVALKKLNKIITKYENKRFGWLSNFTPKEALTAIKGFINDLKKWRKESSILD